MVRYYGRIHFNFKADGTFEQIMPAWEEKNKGKYTISGDLVSFELTSLEWLWDRNNGYDNVFDQYGCFWNPDPFAQFCIAWPGRARFSAKFSFDKNGHLRLEPVSEDSLLGLSLVYHKNPGFKPEPMIG